LERETLVKLFFALCMLFGVLNIVLGLAILYGYIELHAEITSSLAELNQTTAGLQQILANSTATLSASSASVNALSANLTSDLGSLQRNLSAINQSFYQEAGYFSSLNIGGVSSPQMAQIGSSLRSIGGQFGSAQQNVGRLSGTVELEAARVEAPLSYTNQSVTRLQASAGSLVSTTSSELNLAENALNLLMPGLAAYMLLQGVLFILLGVIASSMTSGGAAENKAQKQVKKARAEPIEQRDEKEGSLSGLKDWFYK
jgi:hypothetical protein